MNFLKVRQRREELNYTQEYVATQLGISQSMYSMLESGRSAMSVDQLVLVAQVLDTNPNEFLYNDPVVVNMDNAKLDNNGSVVFLNNGSVNQTDNSKEVLELLKQVAELLATINGQLKKG